MQLRLIVIKNGRNRQRRTVYISPIFYYQQNVDHLIPIDDTPRHTATAVAVAVAV